MDWFKIRGYKENCISRCMKEYKLTENQMAGLLCKELIEVRFLLRYDDVDLSDTLKSFLDFVYFFRFDHSINIDEKVTEYIAYRKSLENPPF